MRLRGFQEYCFVLMMMTEMTVVMRNCQVKHCSRTCRAYQEVGGAALQQLRNCFINNNILRNHVEFHLTSLTMVMPLNVKLEVPDLIPIFLGQGDDEMSSD